MKSSVAEQAEIARLQQLRSQETRLPYDKGFVATYFVGNHTMAMRAVSAYLSLGSSQLLLHKPRTDLIVSIAQQPMCR